LEDSKGTEGDSFATEELLVRVCGAAGGVAVGEVIEGEVIEDEDVDKLFEFDGATDVTVEIVVVAVEAVGDGSAAGIGTAADVDGITGVIVAAAGTEDDGVEFEDVEGVIGIGLVAVFTGFPIQAIIF
jgi:hypothetical protein